MWSLIQGRVMLPALIVILRETPSQLHKNLLTLHTKSYMSINIYNGIPQSCSRKITFHNFTKNRVKIFFKETMHLNYSTLKHYLAFSSIYDSSFHVWMVISFLFVFLVISSYMTSKFTSTIINSSSNYHFCYLLLSES